MYNLSVKEALENLQTSKQGLSEEKAREKLARHGENVLPSSGGELTRLKIFLSQWKSPLILILLVAGIASGLLGEVVDMTVIFITIAVNVLVGFFQENKANTALNKLRSLITYKATVLRNGETRIISSEDVVVGDILLLEAGDRIQADGRIIEQIEFTVDESLLTGESEPVSKHTQKIGKDVGIGDKSNMVFRGTTVTNGRARIVVSATGVKTEIGHIASLVKETKDEKTPLQEQLGKLSKFIAVIVLLISLAIFLIGVFSPAEEHSLIEMFETAVAVAVAAIPEGLVISLTVILAIGMQFILRKKALVRKLVAAETLGSVSVICSDKTGTLTEGNMSVTGLVTAAEDLNYKELQVLNASDPDRRPDAILAYKIGILANDAIVENKNGSREFVGDTTDIAFAKGGADMGLGKLGLEKLIPRKDEVPFDSKRKFIATLHSFDGKNLAYVKGAPEVLLKKSTHCHKDGKSVRLDEKQRKFFADTLNKMVDKGLRTIAVGYLKDHQGHKLEESDIKDLVFVGIFALSDPLRPDVKSTIDIAKKAGIRIVMITGDHARTAQSIAREINLPAYDNNVFHGEDMSSVSDEELQVLINKISIFARVNPKDKIRIVQAFQKNGEVVAMTGDGVNDAPALKGSDIGVAVGSGTDVAKETADIVLQDDRLGTIVDAVEEGRGIYQNIKKVVLYLLSGSFAEVILISGSLIAGLPLAVLPAQILWVNLIEDSFPNMALAFDKGDKENMSDPPRKKNDPIIDREMRTMILIISLVSNFILFGLFLYYWNVTGDIALTRTIMFVGLGIDSLLYIYSVRSMRRHVWSMNPFDNRYLTGAVLFGWVMLVLAVYWDPLQYLLRTVSLGWQHWTVMIIFGFVNILLIEIIKGFFFNRRRV